MADLNNNSDDTRVSSFVDPKSNPTSGVTSKPSIVTTIESPPGEPVSSINRNHAASSELESRPRESGSVFEKIIPTLQTHEKFYYRLYFLFRYFTIFTGIFLAIISTLYGISNMTKLEVENFFCPFYSAEEVHQHNINNRNNK